jgi:hypothetical protein
VLVERALEGVDADDGCRSGWRAVTSPDRHSAG